MSEVKHTERHYNSDDLTGKVLGRLTVVARTTAKRGRDSLWDCVCVCGAIAQAYGVDLVRGKKKSCGCLRREVLAAQHVKHEQARILTRVSWRGMKRRCYSHSASDYKNYGGRGISVCDRWCGESGFDNFLADMGERPANKSLDRIDNNKGYSPENCRWATRTQQNRNCRNTSMATINGVYMSIRDACDKHGICFQTFRSRVARGLSVERALTEPITSHRRKAT